jgi:hypothetical protein
MTELIPHAKTENISIREAIKKKKWENLGTFPNLNLPPPP